MYRSVVGQKRRVVCSDVFGVPGSQQSSAWRNANLNKGRVKGRGRRDVVLGWFHVPPRFSNPIATSFGVALAPGGFIGLFDLRHAVSKNTQNKSKGLGNDSAGQIRIS